MKIQNLPVELQKQIFYFSAEHPCAKLIKKDYDHIIFTTGGEVDGHRLKCYDFIYSECSEEIEDNEEEYEHRSEIGRKSLIYDEYAKRLVEYNKTNKINSDYPEHRESEDNEDTESECDGWSDGWEEIEFGFTK